MAAKSPPGRGVLVLGTATGRILLGDARRGPAVQHTALAHGGGLAALDARGDMVLTAGYSMRMGHVSALARAGGQGGKLCACSEGRMVLTGQPAGLQHGHVH